jgi:hypothetical protein
MFGKKEKITKCVPELSGLIESAKLDHELLHALQFILKIGHEESHREIKTMTRAANKRCIHESGKPFVHRAVVANKERAVLLGRCEEPEHRLDGAEMGLSAVVLIRLIDHRGNGEDKRVHDPVDLERRKDCEVVLAVMGPAVDNEAEFLLQLSGDILLDSSRHNKDRFAKRVNADGFEIHVSIIYNICKSRNCG